MRNNPERTAWIVLLSAFAVFCLLATGIPFGTWWYLTTATEPQRITLEVISGTVLLKEPGQEEAVGIIDLKDNLPEGTLVKTDATSWANLTFFKKRDEVTLGTATLYSDTQVKIHDVRSERYRLSSLPDKVVLEVIKGRVRIGVAPAINAPLHFEVYTPHAEAFLKEGSYSVEVSSEESQISVRDGEAQVQAAGETVTLGWEERTSVEIGQSPLDPVPADRNLMVNGSFKEGLKGWQVYNEQGVDGGKIDGTVEVVIVGDRETVSFSRMGEEGNHCETGITQKIDKDVRDYTSLKIRLDVRLIYQSLSGGGYLSSEFPIIVRLDYKDPYGIDRFWTHGFYYQNKDNYPIQNGEQIPRYRWYPYESENLMDALGDVRPTYITGLRIYASGWNYQSQVAEVGLIVK
ncbi:MAG: FecR domain-containing protein [Anaerolineae bacterium]